MSVAFEGYFDFYDYDAPMALEETGPYFVDPPEWHEEPKELGDWDDPDQDYPPVADESG